MGSTWSETEHNCEIWSKFLYSISTILAIYKTEFEYHPVSMLRWFFPCHVSHEIRLKLNFTLSFESNPITLAELSIRRKLWDICNSTSYLQLQNFFYLSNRCDKFSVVHPKVFLWQIVTLYFGYFLQQSEQSQNQSERLQSRVLQHLFLLYAKVICIYQK